MAAAGERHIVASAIDAILLEGALDDQFAAASDSFNGERESFIIGRSDDEDGLYRRIRCDVANAGIALPQILVGPLQVFRLGNPLLNITFFILLNDGIGCGAGGASVVFI